MAEDKDTPFQKKKWVKRCKGEKTLLTIEGVSQRKEDCPDFSKKEAHRRDNSGNHIQITKNQKGCPHPDPRKVERKDLEPRGSREGTST